MHWANDEIRGAFLGLSVSDDIFSPYWLGMKKTGKVDKNLLDVMRIVERREGKEIADELFGRDKLYPDYKGFDIPLPDIVGYRQHSTECVSDSIQETLLFADGLREFTQPILYNMTAQQMDVRSKLVLKYIDWDRYNAYFGYIQKRFRSHYDVINYLRTHKIRPQKYQSDYDEVCKLDPIFHRKRAHSAEAGILALKKLKRETIYTDTGFPVNEILSTLKTILNWMHVPFVAVPYKEIDLRQTVGVIMTLTTGYTLPDGTIHWRSIGHSTSLLRMKEKWYFYDNEAGFTFVDDELVNEFLFPKENTDIYIVFNRVKRYFIKGGSTPTHIWKNGRWNTDMGDLVVDGKYSRYAVLMRPTRNSFYGISTINDGVPSYNLKQCKFKTDRAKSAEEANATVHHIIDCIHSNTDSNSSIFEDLYHYMYDNLDFIQSDVLVSTLDTIVHRPACTPMIHYWVSKIKFVLENKPANKYNWFEVPKLKNLGLQHTPGLPTPPEVLEEQLRLEKEHEERMKLIEQGIDPNKVQKEKPKPKPKPKPKEPDSKPKEPRKPREKLSPCPPGQKRNAKTRKCRPRLEKLSPCPPGQIRDKKTKKCRDVKKYKLHE